MKNSTTSLKVRKRINMNDLNIMDAIDAATSIEVPVNSDRLGAYWVKISKDQAIELIEWHDLQHMAVSNVNSYVPVELDVYGEGIMQIG